MSAGVMLALSVALWCLVLPTPALASVWKSSPAQLALSPGLVLVTVEGKPVLKPQHEVTVLYSNAAGYRDIRSIRMDRDGNFVAACGKSRQVVRFTSGGQALGESGFERPFDTYPLADGGMWVLDRGEAGGDDPIRTWRIMRLDKLGQVTRLFRGDQGPWLGKIWDPYTIEPLSSGNYLVSDSNGHRVVEITESGGIEWSYGTYLTVGSGQGQLNHPRAQHVAGAANVLIADSDNNRVLEVRKADNSVVWQYGGSVGSGPNQLKQPNAATRLANGNTLICDTANKRVIVVDGKTKSVVEEYGTGAQTPSTGALLKPMAVMRAPDGSTIVGDTDQYRVLRYRYKTRHEYVATSGAIDPDRGKTKRFTKLVVDAVRPSGSSVAAEYSMDGRTWLDVSASGALPSSAKGSAIRYRLRMTAGTADSAPAIRGVSITWNDAAPSASTGKSKSGGTGGSASSKSKAGSSSGTAASQGSGTVGTAASRTTSSGSGSGESTTVAAGGSSAAIGGGESGGSSAAGGEAVAQAATKSGWLMSEVKGSAGAEGGTGAGGFAAPDRSLGDLQVPGVALVFIVYSLGVAWSPASGLAVRLFATLSSP
jgi:hypothetical protein